MKNVLFAAIAALGIILGNAALTNAAHAAIAQATYDTQASAAGGEG